MGPDKRKKTNTGLAAGNSDPRNEPSARVILVQHGSAVLDRLYPIFRGGNEKKELPEVDPVVVTIKMQMTVTTGTASETVPFTFNSTDNAAKIGEHLLKGVLSLTTAFKETLPMTALSAVFKATTKKKTIFKMRKSLNQHIANDAADRSWSFGRGRQTCDLSFTAGVDDR